MSSMDYFQYFFVVYFPPEISSVSLKKNFRNSFNKSANDNFKNSFRDFFYNIVLENSFKKSSMDFSKNFYRDSFLISAKNFCRRFSRNLFWFFKERSKHTFRNTTFVCNLCSDMLRYSIRNSSSDFAMNPVEVSQTFS